MPWEAAVQSYAAPELVFGRPPAQPLHAAAASDVSLKGLMAEWGAPHSPPAQTSDISTATDASDSTHSDDDVEVMSSVFPSLSLSDLPEKGQALCAQQHCCMAVDGWFLGNDDYQHDCTLVDLDKEEGRRRGHELLAMLSDWNVEDHCSTSKMKEAPTKAHCLEQGCAFSMTMEQDGMQMTEAEPSHSGLWNANGLNRWEEASAWSASDARVWDGQIGSSCAMDNHSNDEELPEHLHEAVSMAANRAFGAGLFGVCKVPPGGLLVFVGVRARGKTEQTQATAALRAELQLLLGHFAVAVRTNLDGGLTVEYLSGHQHNCCWNFAQSGTCPRPNCHWRHEAPQKLRISLQLSVVKD